jgi:hypothetical protein
VLAKAKEVWDSKKKRRMSDIVGEHGNYSGISGTSKPLQTSDAGEHPVESLDVSHDEASQ